MKDLSALLLSPSATKEQLVVALKETEKAISFDKMFFKSVAKNSGDKEAKRKEMDENISFIIEAFDTAPATVINAFNNQIAFRIDLREIGSGVWQKIKAVLIESAINAYGELTAKGFTKEEATAFVIGEQEEETTQA